jgi:hypothetical protein
LVYLPLAGGEKKLADRGWDCVVINVFLNFISPLLSLAKFSMSQPFSFIQFSILSSTLSTL